MTDTINEKADIVRLWVCLCGRYDIDFVSERRYCANCGKKMIKKRYGELKK